MRLRVWAPLSGLKSVQPHSWAAADWLGERDVAYWSDIDTHGFMMLNRLRATFGNTRSILMDRDTSLRLEQERVSLWSTSLVFYESEA